jgi:hypothetical protein
MEIADVWNSFDDQLAIQSEVESQTPCVDGCCGPIDKVICDSSAVSSTSNWLGMFSTAVLILVHAIWLVAAKWIILSKGMTVEI